jgi:uncharacterized protein YqjF (DUF2071 family)
MNLLSAIKERLETPGKGAGTVTTVLRDVLVITWAVSPDALRPRVPESLPLEILPGPDGGLQAFVQVSVALHTGARWSPLPAEYGESYHRAEVRALVRPEKQRGVFVLQTYVSNPSVATGLNAVARGIEDGRFAVHVEGDPARRLYSGMSVRVTTDAVQLQVGIRTVDVPESTPWGTWESLTTFLLDRPATFYAARIPRGGLTLIPAQRHPTATTPTVSGTVTAARVAALEGIERGEPAAVHLQSDVVVTSYPPRPYRPGA